MSRRVALPLLASGLALLTLAATIIPFEADAIGLAGHSIQERFVVLQFPVIATVLLSSIAGFACWRAPRAPIAPIMLALALGALGGTAALATMPEMLVATPGWLAASRR